MLSGSRLSFETDLAAQSCCPNLRPSLLAMTSAVDPRLNNGGERNKRLACSNTEVSPDCCAAKRILVPYRLFRLAVPHHNMCSRFCIFITSGTMTEHGRSAGSAKPLGTVYLLSMETFRASPTLTSLKLLQTHMAATA